MLQFSVTGAFFFYLNLKEPNFLTAKTSQQHVANLPIFQVVLGQNLSSGKPHEETTVVKSQTRRGELLTDVNKRKIINLPFVGFGHTRETKKGGLPLSVETEANGDLRSTNKGGPSLVGLLGYPASCALWSLQIFFPRRTLFQFVPSPSNLGRLSCRAACP